MYEDPSLANDSSQAVEQIVDNDSIGEDSTVVSGLGSFEEPVRLPDDSLAKHGNECVFMKYISNHKYICVHKNK